MEWSLAFDWRALGRRVWEWIQRVRPLHPSLDLWRPTADSPQEAEQSPPITQDRFLQRIQQAQVDWESESFGVAPAFSGQINQGNKLALYFNMPNPGDASIGLTIRGALGAALDASEDLADTLMHTAANTFTPNTIGGLSRSDHPTRNLNRDGPYPFYYVPGWKMFFASDSPHYQRATQLATRSIPVANGAIFTFGTPDTYPTILNQW